MKKYRFFVALLFVSFLFVLMPVTAKAVLWEVPTGLNPGDTFRWVFVTSTTTQARSWSISTYNDFVNDAADDAGTLIAGIQGMSTIGDIEWYAIASTSSVHARSNVGNAPSNIYTPLGDLVANSTSDLFDGSIAHAINVTEYGNTLTSGVYVWTGSTEYGASSIIDLGGGTPIMGPLGFDYAVWGDPSATNLWWISYGVGLYMDEHCLYAISEDLTVVPIPGAVLLGMLGLGVAGIKLRKYA